MGYEKIYANFVIGDQNAIEDIIDFVIKYNLKMENI